MPAGPPTTVIAVVPAHNEEALIADCVAGIRRAASHPALAEVLVHLVVVLDDCEDATGQRAAAALVGPGFPLAATVVTTSVRNVGLARALGVTQALSILDPVDPDAVWLASTDADSVVPADWLAHHLELRRQGADGCAGTVVVDSWWEHPPTTQGIFEASYGTAGAGGGRGEPGSGHPHVHGTNLGVSLAAYLDAGGFPPVETGEDHALWRALTRAGRILVATTVAPVTTSGRRIGRSPSGFADTLTRLGSLPA